MIVMHGDFDENCDMKITFAETNFSISHFVNLAKNEIHFCSIAEIVNPHQIYLLVFD